MVSLEFFPDTMRNIAHATPHAWGNDAFTDLIARGAHCVVGKAPTDRDIMTAVEWVLDVYGNPDRDS